MLNVSMVEPVPTAEPGLDFVRQEIARVGAPATEIELARAFVASAEARDPRAYDALTPRLRRLVDLVTVAGGCAVAPIPEQIASPFVAAAE